MRYFTKELWAGSQDAGLPPTEAEALHERTAKEWEQRAATYWRQLSRLKPRLDAVSFGFFHGGSMHDGRLVSLQVLDDVAAGRLRSGPRKAEPMEVSIEAVPYVSIGYQPPMYRIRYQKVSRLVVDFPSDRPLFPSIGQGLGDWGYDELTAAGRGKLRHEILFSSGGTILVECGSVVVRKVRPE
jgi:hypothetical protein